jgi:hypothetical protein
LTGQKCVIEINQDATTDDLLTSIAKKLGAPKDKIVFTLSGDKLGAAEQENAREIDTKIQEMFNTNIVGFIKVTNAGVIMVKK